MGRAASNLHGPPSIERNGVLSTFYADAVLLPEQGFGFVVLYNAYALIASTVALPEVKKALSRCRWGRQRHPALAGAWPCGVVDADSGASICSLLRLLRSAPRALDTPWWKKGWGWYWTLARMLLLLGLPRLLLLSTGRYFDHVMLARAMPELVIFLGACSVLGLLNVVIRLAKKDGPCARQRTDETAEDAVY